MRVFHHVNVYSASLSCLLEVSFLLMSEYNLKKERVFAGRAFKHCAGQCLKSAEVKGGATAGNNCDE